MTVKLASLRNFAEGRLKRFHFHRQFPSTKPLHRCNLRWKWKGLILRGCLLQPQILNNYGGSTWARLSPHLIAMSTLVEMKASCVDSPLIKHFIDSKFAFQNWGVPEFAGIRANPMWFLFLGMWCSCINYRPPTWAYQNYVIKSDYAKLELISYLEGICFLFTVSIYSTRICNKINFQFNLIHFALLLQVALGCNCSMHRIQVASSLLQHCDIRSNH